MVEFNFEVVPVHRRIGPGKHSLEAPLRLADCKAIGVGGHLA